MLLAAAKPTNRQSKAQAVDKTPWPLNTRATDEHAAN
jgi:hypothetical protein